jgi:hypothetical protein
MRKDLKLGGLVGIYIIFKNNDNTTDTIVSGSNNIFTNPSAPFVGAKRVIGSNNIVNSVTGIPQVTGSMGTPLTINSNYFGNNTLTVRGPATGSAYNISNNVIQGIVSLGAGGAVANDLTRLPALTFTGNQVIGTMTLQGGQSAILPILATTASITNNIVNGSVTAIMNSSSVGLSNNIIQTGIFQITNNYFSGSAGSGSLTIFGNMLGGGIQTTLVVQGSNPAGTTNNPVVQGNLIHGLSNALHINADNSRVSGSNVYAGLNVTAVIGNTLAVTGSGIVSDLASVGSAFVGRFNANDGIRNKTSDVVFVVGTGTSVSDRKTGFLIDSGSNTFVEGTLNVSGSTTMTGSVSISDVLQLAGLDPLPAGGVGQLAVSASNLYYNDGATWTQIN